jgi:protocatechuate 3,4-dioxygenase beta subunit
MILETEKKLKRRPTTIPVITILSFTLLLASMTFFTNLPQSSFAQTTASNINQTSTAVQSVPPLCKEFTETTGRGPEYVAGSPFREGQDFAEGIEGERLVLSGKVLNALTCKPVQGAVLDLWQTNSSGEYDYKGFDLRGKIVTDKDGKYVLNTIYPEKYPGNITRPNHIHVMVGVPGQPIITTDLYFVGQPRDFDVKDSLIIEPVSDVNGTKIANFDFAVEDYRGFDITKGLTGNPTLGAVFGQGINQSINK